MNPDEIRNWRESKMGSFTVHDVVHEFGVSVETAWSVLEEMEDIEGYRDVAGPRSISPKTNGVVRDAGVRYKIKEDK